MTHWTDALTRLNACLDAVEWARQQPDLEQAWEACKRPDWLLWLLAKERGRRGSAKHRAVVLTTCACARTALGYVARGDWRPMTAIGTAERWARRDTSVTLADVRAATNAATYAAANATYAAYAATYAAYAATNAATYAAANAAYAAANAAANAANAANAATYAATVGHARTDLCQLIRERHPHPPDLSAKKERAA